MEPSGPVPEPGIMGGEPEPENQSSSGSEPVEPQTSEGNHLEGNLARRSTNSGKPYFPGFMRQAPVLLDSDEEFVERTFREATNLAQGASLCHQVLDDMKMDSLEARRFEYGPFRCWEMGTH